MNLSTKILIGIVILVFLLVAAEMILTSFFLDEFAPKGSGR